MRDDLSRSDREAELPSTEPASARPLKDGHPLEPADRLDFERALQCLRLSFLLAPLLVLGARGLPAAPNALLIALATIASYAWVRVLLRRSPKTLLRYQLALRLVDCGLVLVVLTSYHGFLQDAYYDAVYLLFIVAAAATHGRRGALAISVVAGLAVLASRLYLLANGLLVLDARHLTDSLFFAIFFGVIGSAVAFLMRKSAEVVERRDQAWRAELAERNEALAATAAQLEAAMRNRDAFLSSAAHDLKNPLTAVKGSAELLLHAQQREALRSDQWSANLGRINSGLRRMQALIDELSDVARARLGEPLLLEQASVDLVVLARQSIAEHQPVRARREIVLETDLAELLGQWDGPRLQRVVDNLLANALKYSSAESTISLRLAREADSAVLTVADRGIGIPSADLPHIFERFYRARNVVGHSAGMGIGLASAHEIVVQHRGTIEVTSQEGIGTTFTVRLPLEPERPAD